MKDVSMTTTLSLPLPHLAEQFLLRPGVAFLNHGSFGACPRPVFEHYQALQRELEGQPVEFLGRRVRGLLAEARASLEQFIGAEPGTVVFAPNVTHALNIVARSLDLGPDDEVLSTDHEYGAVERAWTYNCEKRRARYVAVSLPLPLASAEQVVEQIWAGVTKRTRVIAISHITSPTAVTLPVAEICRRARAAGIVTVVDGAHAPGQIDLDMQAIGADFYGGNCHKWLCSAKGAGFLYARPEMQARLEPLVVGWGWRSRTPSGSEYMDVFEWLGTDDPSAFLTLPAAIRFQQEHNWPEVRMACHNLLLEASQRVQELTGLPPITPDTADWWTQMRALPLPPCNPKETQARLWDEFQVEVPFTQHDDQPLVRVSIQAYNTPEDVDRLLEGLKTVLS
jgi:isopenicillin-N epimerase